MSLKKLGKLCAGLLAVSLMFADMAPAYAAAVTTAVSSETVKSIERTNEDDITFSYGTWGYTVGTTVTTTVSGSKVVKGGTEITKQYLSGVVLNKTERRYTVSGSNKNYATFNENAAVRGFVSTGKVSETKRTGYTFYFDDTFTINTNKKTYNKVAFDSSTWRSFEMVQEIFEEDGETPVKTDVNGYVAIGEYVAVITAANGDGESLEVPFSVTESATVKDIRKSTIKISDAEYTGKAVFPAPKVTYKGTELKSGTDYKIEYSDNVKKGTGKAVITGIGKYSGTVAVYFDIVDPAGKYTIKFNGNGATSGAMSKLSNRKNGKNYTLPQNKYVKTGYVFTGWNTAKDGSGESYDDKQKAKNFAGSKTSVTLYAQWEPVSYNVKFNANGGTGTMKAITKVAYDKTVKLTANKFKKSGYKFVGWNTKKNGTGTSYKNKASIENLTTKNGKTVTLYAQWKKK